MKVDDHIFFYIKKIRPWHMERSCVERKKKNLDSRPVGDRDGCEVVKILTANWTIQLAVKEENR
jgi:hypothetical protein